jgi:hypothetical protein
MTKFSTPFAVLLCVFFCCTSWLSAQDLPERFWISPDGKRLIAGDKPSSGFYDESKIRIVDLQFTQADWWTQLTNNYATKKDLVATMIYDGKTYPNVGVRFRGNTSYRAYPNKKSYSITMDFVDSTQDVKGYETLHFNNAADDPSMMREVMYLNFNRRHIPAAKANYIHLRINGENFGPYQNAQEEQAAVVLGRVLRPSTFWARTPLCTNHIIR